MMSNKAPGARAFRQRRNGASARPPRPPPKQSFGFMLCDGDRCCMLCDNDEDFPHDVVHGQWAQMPHDPNAYALTATEPPVILDSIPSYVLW